MGARINVEISKPHESYQYTSGDILQIADKIVRQLGKENSKKIAEYLENAIGNFKY